MDKVCQNKKDDLKMKEVFVVEFNCQISVHSSKEGAERFGARKIVDFAKEMGTSVSMEFFAREQYRQFIDNWNYKCGDSYSAPGQYNAYCSIDSHTIMP